ncbi:MAG: ATP-binding protein [Armatimonadetes bacterium]|nr:ATP-binding protein [Armatimonadota bacterium]
MEKTLLPDVDDDRQDSSYNLSPSPENSLCFENAALMVQSARELLDRRPAELVVNLGNTKLIDSSGLRALLDIRKACKDRGVTFRLGSLSKCANRIITMSKLDKVLGVPSPCEAKKVDEPAAKIDLEASGWKISEYRAISDPSIISVLREKAVEAAVDAGVTADDLCDIQIAVGEALTNAYKHGSPHKGVSQILLRCMSCPGAVVFEVQDEGPPFDPNGASAPDPQKMRDHGMGIYLMREAMDVVEFESDCPGNRVRMIKWLGKQS